MNCADKKTYPTRKEAKDAADKVMLKNRGTKLTVYLCSCGQYHVTSMDKKKSRKITKQGTSGSNRNVPVELIELRRNVKNRMT